ncbi:MAG: hypothetical protein ABIE55_04410 [Candidatus Aenigmatarchaeota archaeon]
MKGIELPINILVVVAVAVIVLLGLVALYFSGFMGPAGLMNQEAAKQKYCALIMRSPEGCSGGVALDSIDVLDFDADRDRTLGAEDTGSDWTWGTSTCGAPTGGGPSADGDNLAALLACYFGVTEERNGLVSCGCAI